MVVLTFLWGGEERRGRGTGCGGVCAVGATADDDQHAEGLQSET